jgi:hypothetical protein
LALLASWRENRFWLRPEAALGGSHCYLLKPCCPAQNLRDEKRKSLEEKELCLAPRRQDSPGLGPFSPRSSFRPLRLGERTGFGCGRRPRWAIRGSKAVPSYQSPATASGLPFVLRPLSLALSASWRENRFWLRPKAALAPPRLRGGGLCAPWFNGVSSAVGLFLAISASPDQVERRLCRKNFCELPAFHVNRRASRSVLLW